MERSKPRVFVYSSVVRDLQTVFKEDAPSLFGQNRSVPLYVMLHMSQQADLAPHYAESHAERPDDQEELIELNDDESDFIRTLDDNPSIFSRTSIQLDDGSEAVAYRLAQPQIYTIRKVTSEADWETVLHTYDPTWMSGPLIPRRTRLPWRAKSYRRGR